MNPANFRVRRATLDDLIQMAELWKSMHFPVEDLNKRVTEFQVAESPEGKLVGALGLQMAEKQGRIHSEAFSDFSLADHLRPMLWDRIHAVANNHGLVRLWTQFATPFWNQSGFQYASSEILTKLPGGFAGDPHPWKFTQLRAEVAAVPSIDKEFARFKEAEKERTEQMFRQARVLKIIAAIVAVGVFILVAIWGYAFLKMQGRAPK